MTNNDDNYIDVSAEEIVEAMQQQFSHEYTLVVQGIVIKKQQEIINGLRDAVVERMTSNGS